MPEVHILQSSELVGPEDYAICKIVEFPTLYSGATLEEAKLKLFDQLFNTIGSGTSTNEELVSELTFNQKFIDKSRQSVDKWIHGENVYYGYYKVDDRGFHSHSEEPIIVIESEKSLYPGVKLWVHCKNYPFVPYPNFSEKYSLIYRTDFHYLGDEWIKTAIWFYSKCKEFFNTDAHRYSYAFPMASEGQTESRLQSFKLLISKYDSYEAVSKAYELDYHGDDYDFLSRRWQIELARINDFIDQTLCVLTDMLSEGN